MAADARTPGGWSALAEGRWREARALFEEAVTAGEGAEAVEGLSWAAWWLDDAPAVFENRERAFHLYGEAGEPAAAARMATWMGVDELDFHGAWAVAAGWLARARRLLEPLEPGPDHGWLAFHEGYLANARGETDRAREFATEAAELGRRLGVADLEMLGLALEGASLVAVAEVEDGMRCLDEATTAALARSPSIPISSAWTCCMLVSACTRILDYERAFEWCDRIAEFAERYGSRYMLAFCRAEYGAVHLWRGRWEEAEAQLAAAVEDFARSRPAWAGEPLVELAELWRRRGRTVEAEELLERAGPTRGEQLVRARLALDGGDGLQATELLERLLRGVPRHRRLDRAPALELLVRARIACSRLDEAGEALASLREVDGLVGTAALRACADRAEGVLAAARGDHERARRLLEDAVDGFRRCGAPFEAALARVELAASLAALGRGETAEREAGSARDRLRELGAEPDASRAEALLAALRRARAPRGRGSELTPREEEVLRLLADGLTNHEIAARLVLSEHTVHRHVTNILRKVGVRSRTAAVAQAARSGLFDGRDA